MALGDKQRQAARDRAAANRPPVVGRGDGTGRQDYRDALPPSTPALGEEEAMPVGAREDKDADFSRRTRDAVRRRSGGSCEARVSQRCTGRGEHLHHRLLRRFGNHTAENALDVCRMCHHLIHHSPAKAYATGMMLRSTDSPNRTDVQPGPW